MRDKVVPVLPDNSGKEHLSIVNCGHDVRSGRSAMEGQKETFQVMMGTDAELTQRVVEKSRANSTSNNEIDLWMKVYEQDYPEYPETPSLFPGNLAHDYGWARAPDYRHGRERLPQCGK